ncbi:MAG: FecR family protein [Rhodothermales bacterium]
MKANNRNQLPDEIKDALTQESSEMEGQLERVWDLIGESKFAGTSASSEEKKEMWAQMKERIAGDIETPVNHPKHTTLKLAEDRSAAQRQPLRLVRPSRWLAMAASFAVLMLSGFWYWTSPITETAPYGDFTSVQLPDGSTVELNSGSTITYQRGFASLPFSTPEVRKINLEGEAFFEVTKSTTPFVVETFNTQVGVLGTSFNVRAWSETLGKTMVTLASGKVQVSSITDLEKKTILSAPGDHVVIAGTNAVPSIASKADVKTSLLWRDEGFAVNSESLKSVFAELERRFDIEITVQDESVLEDSLTIMLPKPGTIETILDDICTTRALNYRLTSRGYEIY